MFDENVRFCVLGARRETRNAISEALLRARIECEAHDGLEECVLSPDCDCAILIEDEGDAIERLVDGMRRHNVWKPFIAYSASTAEFRMGSAILKGALEYLVLPLDAASIERATVASIAAYARFRALLADTPNQHCLGAEPRRAQQPARLAMRNVGAATGSFHSFAAHRANLLRRMDARSLCAMAS
jgi:hypothetical protein